MNRCTADSDGTGQETHPRSLSGRGTPRLTRLDLVGSLSRRSCQEKTVTLDGAHDFQILDTACRVSP